MVIAAISPEPKQADDLKKWGRAYWEAVHPYNLGGAYVNFMMDDEIDGRVQATLRAELQAPRVDQEEVRPARTSSA